MNTRKSNIEALRIVCMLMIVGGHILISQESMVQTGTLDFYIGNIYRSFAICAVDVFVLITGYFGILFNVKKILSISFEVTFYSILIFIIALAAGIHTINIKKDVLLLFPVITQRYWFITIYVLLIIVSPLLNLISNKLEKKQYGFLVALIIVVFYWWPTVCYSLAAPSITKDSGYGIVNFCCLYLMGRYIKLYLIEDEKVKRICFPVVTVASGLLLFGANSIVSAILGFYFQQYIGYDSIFCLFTAFALFMAFQSTEMKSKIVNSISKHCFAVYIIHAHPVIWNYFWAKDTGVIKHNLHGIELICYLLLLPPLIYLVCWAIDCVRTKCFGKSEAKLLDWISNQIFCKRINEEMRLIEKIGD